jgi:hypothetical protein
MAEAQGVNAIGARAPEKGYILPQVAGACFLDFSERTNEKESAFTRK